MRRTGLGILGARARDAAEAQQDCTAPGDGKSDQREHERVHHIGCRQRPCVCNEKETERETQRRGEQSRTPTTQCRGKQHRRNK